MSGILFIVSAPSGAGKTSLVAALVRSDPGIRKSVSFTTRSPRAGEVNGREYNFVSGAEFERMRTQGDFVESAQVHGNYYGTSHKWMSARAAEGSDILLEIDWQGAAQVRQIKPEVVTIFILPPSIEALLARLNARGQDAPEVIAERVKNARAEIAHVIDFDYVIINDQFEQAERDLASIIRAERLTRARQLERHRELINRMK